MRYIRNIISPGFNASQLDNEFQKIEASILTLLDRTGVTPNQMQATLDMNSNHIINCPHGTEEGEPVTIDQLQDILENASDITIQGRTTVENNGTQVSATANILNFIGNGVQAVSTGSPERVNIEVFGPDIEQNNVQINSDTVESINFTGNAANVTEGPSGQINVQITSPLNVEDEGSQVNTNGVGILNFTGNGVTATDAGGGQIDIQITGMAGSNVNSWNGMTGVVTADYGDMPGEENLHLDNNVLIRGRDTGNTLRTIAYVDTSNRVHIGNTASQLFLQSNDVPQANYGGTTYDIITTEGGQTVNGDFTANTGTIGNVTFTTGQVIAPNPIQASANQGPVEIGHGGSNAYIDNQGVGALEFRKAGTTYVSVTTTGLDVNGHVDATGDILATRFVTQGNVDRGLEHIRAGAGGASLAVGNTEGGFAWRTDGGNATLHQINSGGVLEEIWINCFRNAGIQFRYNNSTKLTTTNTGVSVSGAITATGDITGLTSDYRTKDIIGEVTPEECLDAVLDWPVWRYTHNEVNKYAPEGVYIGLGAQDVQKDFPELTPLAPFDLEADGGSISGEDYLTLRYDRLSAVLVGAIQAQNDYIEALERRIKALEDKL